MGTVHTCCVNVVGVHETDQRRHCLDLGEQHGLDIFSVKKLVVESVINTGSAADAVSADFTTVDTQLNAATTDVSITSTYVIAILI